MPFNSAIWLERLPCLRGQPVCWNKGNPGEVNALYSGTSRKEIKSAESDAWGRRSRVDCKKRNRHCLRC